MNMFEEAEEDDPYGDYEDQGIDYHALAEKQKAEQMESSSAQQKASQAAASRQPGGASMMSKQALQRVKAMKVKMAINNAMNQVLAEEEAKIDRKLEHISKLDDDDLEELRAKRMEDLKKKQQQRSKWMANDHGMIHEIQDQKEFFLQVKSTKHVICLFYNKTSKWSHLLQEHLQVLCRKHLECKFLQIEADSAPFLIERLQIWMMPTLVLAKDNKVSTQLRGLDWCAPDGKIDTLVLEQKLFEFGFLEETYMALQKQIDANGADSFLQSTRSKHTRSSHQQDDDDEEDDLFD